ncbi:MAG: DNA alkylation repair protein [Patescibacteria group bacterium]
MTEKILLKDQLINPKKITQLALEIKHVYKDFDAEGFIQETTSKIKELELKQRIDYLADILYKYLPNKYATALNIILQALPQPNDPTLNDNDFGDFIYAPFGAFIAKYGCNNEDLLVSLQGLYELTKRFSAEDPIRYFINKFPTKTVKTLNRWADDSNYHVRRLCSEGTRPKLPWSQKIKIDIQTAIPILDKLYCDNTRYVTRSVANHLNDISKIDAELTIQTLKRWHNEAKQSNKEMAYITKHALRTLVKQGNINALEILGYKADLNIELLEFNVPNTVLLNKHLQFSLTIMAYETGRVIVDYTIYFSNKQGQLKNKKVYKFTQIELQPHKLVTLNKKHLLKESMTTRTLYPGVHAIEIQVNGKKLGIKEFTLC